MHLVILLEGARNDAIVLCTLIGVLLMVLFFFFFFGCIHIVVGMVDSQLYASDESLHCIAT